MVNGFEHGASVVKAQKFYEVAKYIALTKHLFGPLTFVYSQKEWDRLSDAEKQVVMKGAQVARDKQRDLAPIREQEAFDFLKQQGMVINDIDTTSFQKAAEGIQNEIAAERGATDLLQKIRSAR